VTATAVGDQGAAVRWIGVTTPFRLILRTAPHPAAAT
jgi:hypothetical protein